MKTNIDGDPVARYCILLLVVFYIIGYILATSVSACEKDTTDWKTQYDMWRFQRQNVGSFSPSSPDTAREYMVVDTVLVDSIKTGLCEDYLWSKPYNNLVKIRESKPICCVIPSHNDAEHHQNMCGCYWYDIWARIDTTWLPKVQVWLTLEEMVELRKLLNQPKWNDTIRWFKD